MVLVPIGFISDHMEVIFDLDTEAAATAAELGLACERAATAGVHPAFVAGLVDLMLERAAVARGEDPDRPVAGDGAGGVVCVLARLLSEPAGTGPSGAGPGLGLSRGKLAAQAGNFGRRTTL